MMQFLGREDNQKKARQKFFHPTSFFSRPCLPRRRIKYEHVPMAMPVTKQKKHEQEKEEIRVR
jgi:hypothetical protein